MVSPVFWSWSLLSRLSVISVHSMAVEWPQQHGARVLSVANIHSYMCRHGHPTVGIHGRNHAPAPTRCVPFSRAFGSYHAPGRSLLQFPETNALRFLCSSRFRRMHLDRTISTVRIIYLSLPRTSQRRRTAHRGEAWSRRSARFLARPHANAFSSHRGDRIIYTWVAELVFGNYSLSFSLGFERSH